MSIRIYREPNANERGVFVCDFCNREWPIPGIHYEINAPIPIPFALKESIRMENIRGTERHFCKGCPSI